MPHAVSMHPASILFKIEVYDFITPVVQVLSNSIMIGSCRIQNTSNYRHAIMLLKYMLCELRFMSHTAFESKCIK